MIYQRVIKLFMYTLMGVCAASTIAFAGGPSTLEGTIQGASCTIHKSPCPLHAKDPHTALERDFVIVTSSGEYYFLPNLSRVEKMKYLNSQVRVTGDKQTSSFIVSTLDVKEDGVYKKALDVEEIDWVDQISF